MPRLAFAALAAAAVAILPAAEALAQAWPNKTIKFVVPQPAGGSNDAMGRAVGEQLSKQLGQPIVVDNRPGASGAVGMEVVSSSPADGYTFVVASDTVALQPVLRKGLKWNVERDFVPVTMFGAQPIVVAVPANSPYKTMKEVIAAAKASPGKIGYATSGQGSLQHLAGELLAQMAGIDLLHIPYKGGGQAITDLVGGQVPVGVLGLAAVLPHAKNGRVRILAVTTKARSPAVPDVPTLEESGVAGYDVRQWAGLMAPAATPPDVLAKMQKEIAAALATPALKERIEKLGFEVTGTAGKDFVAYLDRDRARWSKVIAERKLELD
ncbi:MAG: tripartite tricarboxylate transporter substrate binding protein [Betaproteobacteria bacterium]|nr:tripartite tricarboxylate transporter substrate binding protein [Betaproteobacteria bacterium]